MTRKQINSGSPPIIWSNVDRAFENVNENFIELYNEINQLTSNSLSWDNITNKPTIPTDVSDLTDNQNLLVKNFDGGFANSTYEDD
jgi:hypothetical protein